MRNSEKWLSRMKSSEHRKIQKENAIRLELKPPSQWGNKVNLGRKHTEETKKKMSEAHKGKKSYRMTEEIREKISKAKKGCSTWNKGIKKPLSYCIKCGKELSNRKNKFCKGCSKLGNKSHFWKGGISFEPYSIDWTDTLKRSIRQRDNYICQICGKEPAIYCHHIDYNKQNCNPDNLITLCHNCHSKTNYNRSYWINYFTKITVI